MDKVTRILADSRYLLLTTFRRNGKPVPTPVWVVGDGGSLAVWSDAESGKVKRIRREPGVELAPCDALGKPHGEPVRGRAIVLDPFELERVQRLLTRKYGLAGRAYLAAGRLRRDRPEMVAVSITVGG
ncbi:PPOX class F420-dependent oxidoreductase [Saccharopolyspora erythraea]|uniref:PPOX class F420-dependent oxidoreductase n=1 Tax=Saccharopolyspora erythraea TaxID=1836 RepID=UPI001BA5615E|nr:PPOX class F420-dependent oxidoreductase [Saccharopolyspora erythraea]QUH00808.1 PPOX class F420-dependent oxidoreductase [Saccharopolyspora erythraea]